MAETAYNYEIRKSHPFVRHGLVLLLFMGGVGYVGDRTTGGIDNIKHWWVETNATHAYLSNINLDDKKTEGETNMIGTAATACLDPAAFGADRVNIVNHNPDTFTISVRKIGAGTLNAAEVENCIFTHTGFHNKVIEH